MNLHKIITTFFFFFLILSIVYILLNIAHLTWIIIEPEGFWGFLNYLSVLGTVIFALGFIVIILFIILFGIGYLLKDFPRNLTFKNIGYAIGVLFLFIIVSFINSLTSSGIDMFISKSMAKRYSYIYKTEKLFNEGKFKEALEDALNAYMNYGTPNEPAKFFVLSRIYSQSKYGKIKMLTKQYASTYNYAFCLERNRTNLPLCENLYKKTLWISDSTILNQYADYKIIPHLSLANFYLDQERYNEAQYHFNALLKYSNLFNEEDIETVCSTQETFATHFQDVGDYHRAKILKEENVSRWEENDQNLESITYLNLLLSTTGIEILTGDFEKAGKYLEKATPLAEKREKKSVYPVYLIMKGNYCQNASKTGNGNLELIKQNWFNKIISFFGTPKSNAEKFGDEAKMCFEKILEFENDANGKYSIGYVQGLHKLGSFYLENDNKYEAQKLFNDAFEILTKIKENKNNLYYSVLINKSVSEYELKGFNNIKIDLEQIEDYHYNRVTKNYMFLTEKEKETYKNSIDKTIHRINSIYIASNTEEARRRLYNNIIATKEIALYANEHTRKFVSGLNDTLKREYFEILQQRDSLEISKKSNSNSFDWFKNQTLIKEREIQRKIASIPSFTAFDPRLIKWYNIQNNLQINEVAIEFIQNATNKSIKYYALVIRKGMTSPCLIPLFDEAELVKILKQPGFTNTRINTIYDKLKDSLYKLVWEPILPELNNVNKVYISTTGLLYTISFPALVENSKYDVELLSSTRQIGNIPLNIKEQRRKAILIGGINYGDNTNNDNSRSYKEKYKNLPYTITEIEGIKNILSSKYLKENIFIITKDSADEANFRKLPQQKPDIIHLATHGYYHPTKIITSTSTLSELYLNTDLNPMIRSGLVLAGANNHENDMSKNDGLLTAQEIAQMDLSGVDLVVLSACESGLGDIIGSEGVFGLQRAFRQAGAKSLITSLWKVDDKITAELMSLFYKNYINGMTKALALKNAQLVIKSKYKDPFYWGGFTLLE
jgi:CHAT domain-containing protein